MPVTIDGTSGVTTPGMTLGTSIITTPSGSAPSYTCRAWVNFNGTGTVAIVSSGNMTSITDNGIGDYSLNFTSAMPDVNYALAGSCTDNTNASANLIIIYSAGSGGSGPSTTSCRIATVNTGSGAIDLSLITAMVVR